MMGTVTHLKHDGAGAYTNMGLRFYQYPLVFALPTLRVAITNEKSMNHLHFMH
jgi:hypothetical protein